MGANHRLGIFYYNLANHRTAAHYSALRKEPEMYHITPKETQELLDKLREIRRISGEMMAFLEHMRQLQSEPVSKDYDPDDYLESWVSNLNNMKGQ